MTDIVAQAHRLDQVFVEKQVASYGSCYPGDKLDMQYPVGDVIVSDQAEYLGFIDIAGVGPGVQYTVGVLGIVLPVALQLLFPAPHACS